MATPLNIATHVITNGHTIEASAGTGKTYSVAALVTRAIATDDDLRIDNILITTFTRAAAAELRDRVRRRLVDTADALVAGTPKADDVVLESLLADEASRERYTRNLRRAVVNFDNATISTIHAVCSRILTMAGQVAHDSDAEELARRAVTEAVNDRLVSEAVAHDRIWDETRICKLVQTRLSNPLAETWFDDTRDPADVETLRALANMLDDLVAEVNKRTEQHPSFNDLIRRAEMALRGEFGDDIRRRFAERYSHAFVDEAQDTDQLQWRLFHHIFPKHDVAAANKLTAVGDPKQAIYSFRGADVYAYLAARDVNNMSTLDTNFRSDPPVIDALNALFAGKPLGKGIDYHSVSARPGAHGSNVRGVAPVEAIDIGDVQNQPQAALMACGQVVRLLNNAEVKIGEAWHNVEPKHICVLTGSNSVVRRVQAELQRLGIPAVASGAESVFNDTTADDLQALFEALERISDPGRVRNLATTSFFGFSLADPRLLPDDMAERDESERDLILAIQEKLVGWRQVLLRGGVAALAARLSADVSSEESDLAVMNAFVAGPTGERRLADFSHIIDLLHAQTNGRGVTPTEVLDVFADLKTVEGSSDVVSRRIESDADAVQIMTIHKAKGLQFPFVVVADLWKPREYTDGRDIPKIHQANADGTSRTIIDIGWACGMTSQNSITEYVTSQVEEQQRLLYVALTRPEHHLSFLWPSQSGKETVIDRSLNVNVFGAVSDDGVTHVPVVQGANPQRLQREADVGAATTALHVADGPEVVEQTYRRTSFSGITRAHKSQRHKVGTAQYDADGAGNDEEANWFVSTSQYASADTPTGVHMPLARVAGGKYVGKLLHKVYEHIDTAAPDLKLEVDTKCRQFITGALLGDDIDAIVDGVHLSLITPLGPSLGNVTLADISPERRLAELNFEMSVAELAAGVKVSDFGRIVSGLLGDADTLAPYVEMLQHESFDIELAGLLNGSIDAVLQLGTDADPQLWITDYKSNRLDAEGDDTLIAGYEQVRMFDAMVHHHYPLQALIYGTAMYRYLRWRAPHLADPASHVKGFSYFFIRGMVGPDTPVGSGVFTWQAPPGLWSQLSHRLAGDVL